MTNLETLKPGDACTWRRPFGPYGAELRVACRVLAVFRFTGRVRVQLTKANGEHVALTVPAARLDRGFDAGQFVPYVAEAPRFEEPRQ